MSDTIKRDTNADLMKGVLNLVKENGWYDEAESIMDYFLPEEGYVKELTNYEFDFKAVVEYGGSEGIYLNCYLEGSFDGSNLDDNMATIRCGTFKTLGDSLRHALIMGELSGALTYYARQYLGQNFSRYCLITNN